MISLPAGHGSIWDYLDDVVEVDEDGNFVFPEIRRWYREGALVFVVPENNSVEFWMDFYGHPEPTEELEIYARGLLFPHHLLELGEMFDVDTDGSFALPIPAGDYLLCVGTMEEGGFETEGCDTGYIDDRHVYVSVHRYGAEWHMTRPK